MASRKSRWLLVGFMSLAVALVASACGQKAAEQQPPLKIGVVTSKTGALQNYGLQEIRGFELGLEYATGGTMEVLGRKIEVIVEDDGGDPTRGAQAAQKLLEQDGVEILQGSASSAVALQIIPIAEKAQKIFVVDPAASTAINTTNFSRYVFRTGRSVAQDALAGGQALVADGRKRFMNFAPDYDFGRSSAAAWSNVIKAYDGEVIGDVYAPLETTDFTQYLQRVIAAKPDGVVVTWAGTGAVQLFQQIAELGMYGKMVVFTGIGDIPSLKAMGTDSEGLVGINAYYYQLPKNEVNDWLVKRHQEKFGEPPDLFTAGGFAAAQAIIEGINKAGSTDAEALIASMEGLSFQGPKGTYTLRKEDHQALQPMYLVQLKKVEGFDYLVPQLLREFTPEETAPPVQVGK